MSQRRNTQTSLSSTSTSTTQSFPPGLPGKNVKVTKSNTAFLPYKPSSYEQVPSNPPSRGPSPQRRTPNALGIISVDTKVSRHQAAPPRQVFPNAEQEASRNESSTKSATPTQRKKRRDAPKPLNLVKELSPNDGLIPILYSSTHVSTASTGSRSTSERKAAVSPPSARPPAIVITPVEKPELPTSPSSLYSRLTIYPRQKRAGSESQSVRFAKDNVVARAASRDLSHGTIIGRSRRASNSTEIEDDSEPDSPVADEETPLTASARANQGNNSAATDGLPTPRRSRGWWNVVFPSPFFNRFSAAAMSIRGLPDQNEPVPDVPTIGLSSPTGAPRALNDQSTDHVEHAVGERNETPRTGAAADYYDAKQVFSTPPAPALETENLAGERLVLANNTDTAMNSAIGHPSSSPTHTPQNQSLPTSITMQKSVAERAIVDSSSNPQQDRALQAPKLLHHIQTTTIEEHRTIHDNETKSPSPVLGVASVGVGYRRSARSIDATRPASTSPRPEPPSKDSKHQTLFPGAFTPPVERDERDSVPEKPLHRNPVSEKSYSSSSNGKVDCEKPTTATKRSIFSQKPAQATTQSTKPSSSKRQRCFLVVVALFLVVTLLLALILAMILVKNHTDMPVQAAWLNITGYPPIQTGISTIAQASTATEDSCIQPAALWSCGTEMQSNNDSNADQPNFRFEIRFQNSTAFNASSLQPQNSTTRMLSGRSPTAAAYHIVRHAVQKVRRDFTDLILNTNPPPPGQEDQSFIGTTTDNNRGIVAGEPTPFFISLLLPTNIDPASNAKSKRQAHLPNLKTYANLTDSIPSPAVSPNGTAAPGSLYPFPEAQPLMIYNRDKDDEHYGFYTYYDRTILMRFSNVTQSNSSDTSAASDSVDGPAVPVVALADANAQCTWSQTRMKISIWTKKNVGLLQSGSTAPHEPAPNDPANSSANDFIQPGSFALPVTISIDRHGGDPSKKGVYCYGLSADGMVDRNLNVIWPENRASNGKLVAPADSPFTTDMKVAIQDGGMGGIDGGSGGCTCEFQNWRS